MSDLICPNCENFDSREFLGIEVRGVYDGVLFWVCQVCGRAFPRNWQMSQYRAEKAKEYADRWNNQHEEEN